MPIAQLCCVASDLDCISWNSHNALRERDGDRSRASGADCAADQSGGFLKGGRSHSCGRGRSRGRKQDNWLAIGHVDAGLAIAIRSDSSTVAIDIGPLSVRLLSVEAVLSVGATAGIGSKDDQVSTRSAPGVSRVRYVQMCVVVSGKTAGCLACGGQLGDGLVQVRVSVEAAAPQVFAVGRVSTTCIPLLGPVIQDWDATG